MTTTSKFDEHDEFEIISESDTRESGDNGLTEWGDVDDIENQAYDNMDDHLYRDAIRDFTDLLHCFEDEVEYYVNRAECYYRDSSLFDAAIDLNEAEMLNPDEQVISEIAVLRDKIDKTASISTHYDVLAVPQKASGDQIKLAFMNLSILHELDLQSYPNEAEKRKIQWKFAMVEKAFATLSDSKARDEYDSEVEMKKSNFNYKVSKYCRRLIRKVVPGNEKSHILILLCLFVHLLYSIYLVLRMIRSSYFE